MSEEKEEADFKQEKDRSKFVYFDEEYTMFDSVYPCSKEASNHPKKIVHMIKLCDCMTVRHWGICVTVFPKAITIGVARPLWDILLINVDNIPHWRRE